MFLVFCGCKEEMQQPVVSKTITTWSLIQDSVLVLSCAKAGCHLSVADTSFSKHKLVLEKTVAYQNLVGVSPTNAAALSDGLLRVKAYSSLQSLFFHKLNNNVTHHIGKQYGAIMPLNAQEISAGKLEFIRRWIEAGAPETGNVVDVKLLN